MEDTESRDAFDAIELGKTVMLSSRVSELDFLCLVEEFIVGMQWKVLRVIFGNGRGSAGKDIRMAMMCTLVSVRGNSQQKNKGN